MTFEDYCKAFGEHFYDVLCTVRDTNDSYSSRLDIGEDYLFFSLMIPSETIDLATATSEPDRSNEEVAEQLGNFIDPSEDYAPLFAEVQKQFNHVNETTSAWKQHPGDNRFLMFSGRMVLMMMSNVTPPGVEPPPETQHEDELH